ncbi:hypothetical protein [Sphaerisporangium corydalis]|uniref:Uncharacterized protein n=1 Tax=Sphaerisporangium corydalis TaxID=1441875 RepID=A0ABV9ESB2_9ACTN|nr:hypothetical protein [Sphaerisporangium corydalis]
MEPGEPDVDPALLAALRRPKRQREVVELRVSSTSTPRPPRRPSGSQVNMPPAVHVQMAAFSVDSDADGTVTVKLTK